MVVWGSLRARRVPHMVTLAAAILVLWIAMFVDVDSDYCDWQNTPHPPDEVFSDTGGPFFVLLRGWLPSLVVLGIAHLVRRWCWRNRQLSSAPPSDSA